MRYEPGMRVFALIDSSSETVRSLGFGTYVGDEIPPGCGDVVPLDMAINAIRARDANHLDVWPFYEDLIKQGKITQEKAEQEFRTGEESAARERERPIEERAHELLLRAAQNPKIELDNGDVVWGYQCWWGPAEKYDETIAGRKVIDVRINNVLKGA